MKFIAIAALVATASAADKKSGEKCTKDDKCPTTDCCGTVETITTGFSSTDYKAMKTGVKVDICHTKDKKVYQKDYSGSNKATKDDDFVTKDTNTKVEGKFTCLATTGASSLTAAAAVLAASFYMA